jgi:5-oxoprolinase (ATP-hydrolysing) subunit A
VGLVAGDLLRCLTARIERPDDVPEVILGRVAHHHHGADHDEGDQDQDEGEFHHALAGLPDLPPDLETHSYLIQRAPAHQLVERYGAAYDQQVRELDLNADVGEGQPEVEEALLTLVSSANVACGLHAGDPDTMRATVGLALRHGVAVGAHPGFNDREGFGRRPVQLTPTELADLLLYQLGALNAIARAQGTALRHIKPHGALYNQAESDEALAVAMIAAIRAFDSTLPLVGRAGSAMARACAALAHPFTAEAFADRRYRRDGSLVPRSEPGSVLTNGDEVAAQVRSLVTDGEVVSGDGSRVPVTFETLCLHGDTPGSPALAGRVRQELAALGVTISAPPLLGVDTLPS